jgi:site-specific DNA-cytosine methylase
MNSLSLFSGAGGGLLAEKYLLNWRSIGYVENNVYCQKVIAQRIEEGFLELAPLWGDIDEFIESGAVDQYKGLTDVADSDSAGPQGFGRQPESVPSRPAVSPAGDSCQEDRPDWWELEPDVGRVAHGVASRVDRLKAIGNGQVPLVAATAWKLLSGQGTQRITLLL